MDNNKVEENKMDAILAAIPWRCFHCDFITRDPEEAKAHFGERDDAEEFTPICKWWSEMPEDERKYAFQDLQREVVREQENAEQQLQRALEAEREVENLGCRIESLSTAMKFIKPFAKCDSIRDVFNVYDSMEGRALAAEERLREAGMLV
jgi:hypothetical protein